MVEHICRRAVLSRCLAEPLNRYDYLHLWKKSAHRTVLTIPACRLPPCRYLQEQKWRRQQGLDHGQPSWSPECEAHLAAVQARALSALCFAAVKPAAA